MIEKYCSKNNIVYDIIENTDFIIVIRIEENSSKFNFLHGMHKLVRVSPFGKGDKTHTSLCRVSVSSPQEKVNVVLEEKDIRMDFFKSTGPGGQHRNKTMSAVRLLHIPTKIIVTSASSRSQHDNRRYAYEQLMCRLEELSNEKNKLEKEKVRVQELIQEDAVISYYLNHNFIINDKKGIKTTKVKQIMNGDIDLMNE